MKFYIETERLIMRDLLQEDAEAMFEMDSDPVVHRYLGNNPSKNLQQVKDAIASVQQQYADHGIGRWSLIEKSTGLWVGWGGLKWIEAAKNERSNYYDVGYRLHPAHWGKGYATESAKASLRYGFTELKPEEIIGTVHKENAASRRALQKCGLTYVEDFYWNDLLCEWMHITRNTWKQLQ